MSVLNFIPSIWSARLLDNLHKVQIYGGGSIINRDYEGEIANAGDSVRINAIGPVTIYDYTTNTDINTPEQLTDAQTVLLIDKQKYYNFAIDDVDKRQSNADYVDDAMREAAYAMSDGVDQAIAGKYTDASPTNDVGTTAAPKTDIGTVGKLYEYIVDLKVKLDAANVPSMGRYVVIPPWAHGWLLKDTAHFVAATESGAGILKTGLIGRAAGFDIFLSNNVPIVSSNLYKIQAGYNGAITYADQLTKTEAFRPERRFADAIKGLYIYGCKVTRPQGLAVLTAQLA